MARCRHRSTRRPPAKPWRRPGGDGFDSVAICLLHGYRHTDHEARLAAMARDLGFGQVSVSHEVSPLMKLVSRGDTTVVDAYLSPVLGRYVERVDASLRPRPDDTTGRRPTGPG